MRSATSLQIHSLEALPRVPSWVRNSSTQTLEEAAFLSGAALTALHIAARHDDIPQTLWRDRLALRAAEACSIHIGRSERAPDLRDAVYFLRPGDQPGPAGAVLLAWQRLVARPLSVAHLGLILPNPMKAQSELWRAPGQGGPVAQAAGVLERVLVEYPRQEAGALMLADAVLARALGWHHAVPLLAAGLRHRDLRRTGLDLRLACHRALIASANEAVRMATDLTRYAARMQEAAPKLRSKAATQAVELFLTHDALSPTPGLTGIMSARSARRLCDRLVNLGALRELTGRDAFRLYGV